MYHCRCNLVPVYHCINTHRYRVRPGFLKYMYTLGQPSFIVSTRLSFFLPSFLPYTHDKNQKPKTKNQKNTPHIHEFESVSACHCSCRNIDRHADRKLQQPGWKSGPMNVFFSFSLGSWKGVYVIRVPCNYLSPFFFFSARGGRFFIGFNILWIAFVYSF